MTLVHRGHAIGNQMVTTHDAEGQQPEMSTSESPEFAMGSSFAAPTTDAVRVHPAFQGDCSLMGGKGASLHQEWTPPKK